MSSQCRVVITGLGLVTPLGLNVSQVWKSLISGKSGLVRIPPDFSSRYPESSSIIEKLPSKVTALVPRGKESNEFNIDDFSSSQRRQMSLSTLFAIRASNDALSDAGFKDLKTTLSESERDDFGVAIGSGMIDLEDVYETGNGFYSKGYSKISPYFVPRILPNLIAGQVAISNGLRGPNHCSSTACTTGTHSIGDAFTMIKRRQASVMICGGSEASVSPLAMAGFCRLRALSTKFNENPTEASRPFDVDRDGFVIGEGAGIVILEEYEHAVKRGAPRIYGEILGYGLSGDGYHITSPDKEGKGAYLCMKRALVDAGLKPANIGYINAHATSTPQGDEIEALAIRRLFDQVNNDQFAVSSTKGAIGHLLGAAGAVEFIFALLSCHHGTLPPTLNLHKTDIDLGLNFVPLISQSWHTKNENGLRIALTNSFGFGGTNILCLHGYRQNGDAFREKTGGLRKYLSKMANFYFLSAPHIANVDPPTTGNEDGDAGVGREPRAWWFSRANSQFSSRDVTDICDGFDETVALLDETFRNQGPFDGILGFSQGACLTSLICSMKERGEFAHNFNFVILFAGFQSGSSKHRHLIETQLTKPSLHIVGESDGIISEAMFNALIKQFQGATVVKHPRGHMVPSSKPVGTAVAEFLRKMIEKDNS